MCWQRRAKHAHSCILPTLSGILYSHCTLAARSLHARCTLAVRWLYAGCTLAVRWLYAVRWLHAGCTLAVRWLYAGCTLAARWLHAGWPYSGLRSDAAATMGRSKSAQRRASSATNGHGRGRMTAPSFRVGFRPRHGKRRVGCGWFGFHLGLCRGDLCLTSEAASPHAQG